MKSPRKLAYQATIDSEKYRSFYKMINNESRAIMYMHAVNQHLFLFQFDS